VRVYAIRKSLRSALRWESLPGCATIIARSHHGRKRSERHECARVARRFRLIEPPALTCPRLAHYFIDSDELDTRFFSEDLFFSARAI